MLMMRNSNLQVKGGTSLTNPYKVPYEIVLAESREAAIKYNKSGRF